MGFRGSRVQIPPSLRIFWRIPRPFSGTGKWGWVSRAPAGAAGAHARRRSYHLSRYVDEWRLVQFEFIRDWAGFLGARHTWPDAGVLAELASHASGLFRLSRR